MPLSNIIALVKKPTTWIVVTAVGVAGDIGKQYIKDGGTYFADYVFKSASEKTCEFVQDSNDDDSKFKILVSPLTNDPDGKHTNRVMAAFGGERRFGVFQICESLKLDYTPGADLQTSEEKVLQRGKDIIKTAHGDLLLFGDVLERDRSVRIYAINEHGGCDFRPKPTIIKDGVLPDKFSDEEKENLIAVSLQEIQAACSHLSPIDWQMFAKRMNKMEMFLKYFDRVQDNYIRFAGSYILATSLLYKAGQGDIWFSKGNAFGKPLIDEYKIGDKYKGNKNISKLYFSYSCLLHNRFDKTHEKNDSNKLLEIYNRSIELDPIDFSSYTGKGLIYKDNGDLDRAIEEYDKAVSLAPKSTIPYKFRGAAYSEKGDFDRAIADFDKVVSIDPKDPEAYISRGAAYTKKGDFDGAIADYDKAISINPKSATAYNDRGYVYEEKRDLDRAIADYDKAISIDPKSATIYRNRGQAYRAKGDLDRAIADYDKAISIDPKSAIAYSDRGDGYQNKGDFDRAIADFDKAVGFDPKFAIAYSNRGFAYQKKGDLDRAIEDYTTAIGLDPKDSLTYQARGEAYKAKGDMDHANADFQMSAERKPN